MTVYGPYPYGSSQDRQETLNQNRPLYFLLNLTDVIGIDKTLRADTLRFYMTDILSNTNITIQFGVFRLTDGATFGDYTTYKNNSTQVGQLSIPLTISNTDGSKNDGKGFF